MNKLEKLTPDQEILLNQLKDNWLNKVFNLSNKFDKDKAKQSIKWLYELADLEKPVVIFVANPLASQYAIDILKNLFARLEKRSKTNLSVWRTQATKWFNEHNETDIMEIYAERKFTVNKDYSLLEPVEDIIRDTILEKIIEKQWDELDKSVSDTVWDQVKVNSDLITEKVLSIYNEIWNHVYNVAWSDLDNILETFDFCTYGNVADYGWVAFFDYFKSVGIASHPNFDKFLDFINIGVYGIIPLRGFCICCKLPSFIYIDDKYRLHHETKNAVTWPDGYKQWYWHGVSVNQKIIETPHLLTDYDLSVEKDEEVKSCIIERMKV